MAPTNQQVTGVVVSLVSVLFLIQRCHAFEFKVGGSQGWTLPTDPNAPIYNQWASKNRFQIGDSLLFVYSADHDSVLHVTKDDYDNCSVEKPLDKFTDGHSVYKFNQSGSHYFISGVAENCHKNEKLIVVVLADRTNHSNGTTVDQSPPPSPYEDLSPPSPAPAGEESPSPPPSEETNPTPSPSEESSPPKNAVSSVAASVVGTIALFFGSSLVLAI
ncbi:hypothetical protein C2S52_013115 [Perilla frutescens var. hirtella]|nr:hypothetical protein C2S52_013115 [Perilla frutescens var. hirtella]